MERWADDAIVVRARFGVAALTRWDVWREFPSRLEQDFDPACIEIPYPQPTVHPAERKHRTLRESVVRPPREAEPAA